MGYFHAFYHLIWKVLTRFLKVKIFLVSYIVLIEESSSIPKVMVYTAIRRGLNMTEPTLEKKLGYNLNDFLKVNIIKISNIFYKFS